MDASIITWVPRAGSSIFAPFAWSVGVGQRTCALKKPFQASELAGCWIQTEKYILHNKRLACQCGQSMTQRRKVDQFSVRINALTCIWTWKSNLPFWTASEDGIRLGKAEGVSWILNHRGSRMPYVLGSPILFLTSKYLLYCCYRTIRRHKNFRLN